VSADQPLTGDELATIKARAEAATSEQEWSVIDVVIEQDVPRLVAEIERLQGELDEIVHTLGPDRVCDCPASIDCGLADEATEALTIARVALGLDP